MTRLTDAEALDRYRDLAPRARVDHPLEPLAFYGAHEVLEGEPVDGIAILGFPSMDAARAWYRSEAYQTALPHRRQGSFSRMYLVESVDAGAPRPG